MQRGFSAAGRDGRSSPKIVARSFDTLNMLKTVEIPKDRGEILRKISGEWSICFLQLNARKYRCRIGKMTKSYPRRIYSAIRNFWQTLRAKCELPTDFRFGFAYNQIFKMSVWDISAEVAHRAIDKSGPILEAIYAFTRLPLLLCGRDSSEYLGIPFSTKMHLLAGCRNEGQKKSSVKQKTHLCAVQKVQRRKSTSLTKHSYESLEKLITQKNCSGLAFTTRDDPVSSAAALNQLVVNM